MGSGFGAGAGADMLQEVLRRKFTEVIQRQHLAQQAAAQQSQDSHYRTMEDTALGNLQLDRDKFTAQQNAQPPVKAPGVHVIGDRLVDDTGKEIYAKPDTPKPPTPLMRLGRDGKLQNLGDVPAGAHVVNEPAAPGSSHARFQITQGSDADGKPAMIRTNVDTGQIEVLPIPAGANFTKREQPTTQDQTNLGLYANRLEQAVPILETLQGSITKMNPLSFGAQTTVDQPMLQSKEVQSYQQAARNFVNAVLRRESGAAISPTEFAEARKQYLPVPGDGPDVLAQKAQNRQIVMDNFKRGAGPAYRPIGGGASAAHGAPSGGTIRARDPQGALHEAKAGTALPAGWTLEK